MPAVNLRHIEIFHAVMTTGNLTEAARMLHTSQPTVSRELARFEKVLGLQLFERTRGRLQPTVQGLRLFEEVQRSWYGLDRIVSAAESLREFRQGELSIACLPVFSQSFLPLLLPPFLARYPEVMWNDDHKHPREALLDSLKKLQLDYIDLYLMHWPVPAIDHYVEAWKGMIELQKEGLIKSIGVCNFQIHHLQRLIDETGVTPVIKQIELHPLMQPRQLHAWNATHKIQTESWSPLAQGGKGVFDQKVIRDLADKYGKTPAQIVIRWHLDSGLVVIPNSVTPSRIVENFYVWDFRLDKDELGEIAKLDQGKRLGPDPDQFGG